MAAVGLVVVLGLAAVACQPSRDDAAAELQSKSLDATPAPALDDDLLPVDPSDPFTDPSAPSDEEYEALYDLLLTPIEMGPDWIYADDDGASEATFFGDEEGPACFDVFNDAIPYRASAAEGYDRDDGDYFAETLSLAGTDVVASEFAQVVAALDGCTTVTFGSGDDAVTGTMTPVPMALGDMARGWEIVLVDDGQTVVMDVGVVGVAGYELTTFSGFLDAPDQATFVDLTARAVAKILSGGGQTA